MRNFHSRQSAVGSRQPLFFTAQATADGTTRPVTVDWRLATLMPAADWRPPTVDGIQLAPKTAGAHPMDVTTSRLCYLDASKVMGPTGLLASLDVRTSHDEPLGSVDGVLIDPAERKLRYFVIESRESADHRRYLLPIEAAATMAPEGTSLRLVMETADFTALDEFDGAAVREFTEEDAIAPTFARYLA
jgi:hypothetical protein